MNAKEMLKECDYIKIENANTIEFSRSEEDYIYFEKEKKTNRNWILQNKCEHTGSN